jgi:hypothetical protein
MLLPVGWLIVASRGRVDVDVIVLVVQALDLPECCAFDLFDDLAIAPGIDCLKAFNNGVTILAYDPICFRFGFGGKG